MNLNQWRRTLNRFNDSFSSGAAVQIKEWNDNTIANMGRFKKENSIWRLVDKYSGDNERAMVLVGSSPCLKDDVKKLKDLDENFMIICANSSLKFLLQHGIKPAYVVCLDSDSIDIPQHLDCDNKDITLLASNAVSPKAFDLWKGPIYYIPYYSITKDLKAKIRRRLGRKLPCGGNSITEALVIATIIFGSKTVIFAGNEYCMDKNYYADPNAAKQEKLKTLYPVVDVLGRKRWTLPALYIYAIWTEKTCNDLTPPGFFIDTSFGLLGKDSKAIHVIELSEAIKKVKWAFGMKRKLKDAQDNSERANILQEIVPKDEHKSEVYRYNLQEQRPKLLQLARG